MSRPLWYFVYHAFNRLDAERLLRYGPDRTCAEWILRNGGQISLRSAPCTLIGDYNVLPCVANVTMASKPFRLHSIVADRIGLLAVGFEHLQGCTGIEKIVLNACPYLKNDALRRLDSVSDSLLQLELRQMQLVGDDGLRSLGKLLPRLQRLTLGGMKGVRDMPGVMNELKLSLPNCVVTVE